MSRYRIELHDRYLQLMARAAAGRLLPSGGLTPREQRDHLLNKSLLPENQSGDLHRLTELLEQVVYAGDHSDARNREGLEICKRLFPLLPSSVDDRNAASADPWWVNRWARLFGRIEFLGPYLIAVGLVVVFLYALTQIDFGIVKTSGGAANVAGAAFGSGQHRSKSRGSYATERDAVDAIQGDWSAASHDGRWVKMAAPKTNEPRERGRATTQLDLNTGADGYFPDAIDPFRPPLDWTHRQNVYSEIEPDYTMASAVTPMRNSRGSAKPDSLIHEVDINVRFHADRLVPIPSPSANVVVLDYSVDPPAKVEFLLDKQDGLYARARATGPFRLRYWVASSDDYSFAPLSSAPFEPDGIALPANIASDAQRVIAAIGQLPQPTFSGTVRRLQAYFASFSVTAIQPHDVQDNDFLTVALARKGVCRHRAKSFFVVANAAGVRTRLVENQLHSFCEVRQPNGLWRRIEFRLGNEPGPPLAGGGYWWERPWVAADTGAIIYILVPVLSCGLLALLLHGWRRDVSGHESPIHGSTSATLQRARREALEDGGRNVTLQLVHHVYDQLHRTKVLAGTTLSESAMKHFKTTPVIKSRLRSILSLRGRQQNEVIEVSEMQRAYWDSYHILQWLKGEART